MTRLIFTIGWLPVLLSTAGLAVAQREAESGPRARPPTWSQDVLDAFFADARERLEGERPDFESMDSAGGDARQPASAVPPADEAGGGPGWSRLVDAEVLETEIKRLAQQVAADVTTPGRFTGGGYLECRRHFSLLAVLFGVVSEYDGEVRWQDSAAGLRELFARAGHNAKIGTEQTYREAALRKQDLADLVRGSRPRTPAAERRADWGAVADRPPLMQRLETAHQERLTKWLANEGEFNQRLGEVRHEAQLVALLADVISREGFDYWDDEEYARHARELREAAGEIADSIEPKNFERARRAADRLTKVCADCHEGYRG